MKKQNQGYGIGINPNELSKELAIEYLAKILVEMYLEEVNDGTIEETMKKFKDKKLIQ